jgi:RimJ/RimL family protein N-acetyltransferase
LADLASDLVPPGWDETIAAAQQRQIQVDGPDAVRAIGAWFAEEGTWVGPSGQPIEIRKTRPEDAEAAARAHTASAEAAYRGYAPPEPDGVGRRTAVWRQSLANPEVRSFVAVDDGRIVGVLNVSGAPTEPGIGLVRVLYVRPEWWGTGAGQLLLDRAHDELERDYDEAELTVLAANARARRFYERNGWQFRETLVEPHFGGLPTEVCRYRRRLREA